MNNIEKDNLENDSVNRAFIIFKPHFLVHDGSFPFAIQYLFSLCKKHNFQVESIFETKYSEEKPILEFYFHVMDKPFFSEIMQDFLSTKKNPRSFITILIKEKNIDNPRDEKVFYDEVRKMVNFSTESPLLLNFNKTLRDMFAINKTLNSIHATENKKDFIKEYRIVKRVLEEDKKDTLRGNNEQNIFLNPDVCIVLPRMIEISSQAILDEYNVGFQYSISYISYDENVNKKLNEKYDSFFNLYFSVQEKEMTYKNCFILIEL